MGWQDAPVVSQQAAGDVPAWQSAPTVQDQQQPAQSAPEWHQLAASRAKSIGRGEMDLITGAAQMLAHALPEKVVEAGNELQNWFAKYGMMEKVPTTDQAGKSVKGAAALDAAIAKDEAQFQREREQLGRGGTDWFRLGGNVISPANLVVASKIPQAATLGGRMIAGAGAGAATGALNPVTSGDFSAEKAKQVATGAVLGGAGPAIAEGASRIIKPLSSEAVKTLAEQGVTMTPGQILGGWLQRAEDAASSLPLVGDAIKGAQRRGLISFNTAAVNNSLKPIGEKLPKGVEGQEALSYARGKLGEAYDSLLPKLKGELNNVPTGASAKPSFQQELNNIRAMGKNLPRQQQRDLERIIDNEVMGKFTKAGKASGETLKQIQETLTRESNNFATGGPYDRTLSGGIKEIGSALRRMIDDVNPQYSKELGDINKGYAYFKRAQRAGAATGVKDGIFTPSQYNAAVKALDKTKDKRAFSEGTALGQELAQAGKSVLSQTVPDSGTATRAWVEGLAAGGGAHMIGVPYAGAALAAPAIYSRPGLSAVQAALLSRPQSAQPLAQLVRNSAPALAAGVSPLSQLMMSTQGETP